VTVRALLRDMFAGSISKLLLERLLNAPFNDDRAFISGSP